MRKEIEEKLNIKAYDIYGLSEATGPGVAVECEHQDGLHIFEESFYAEIINPKTGEVLPYGEEGELVLTSLDKEALPMPLKPLIKKRKRLSPNPNLLPKLKKNLLNPSRKRKPSNSYRPNTKNLKA